MTKVRRAELGDILEINLGSNPSGSGIDTRAEDNWVKFFNLPLRDSSDVEAAQKIIDTNGSVFYSKPSFAREFRVRPSTQRERLDYSIRALARENINHWTNSVTGKLIGARG